MAQCLAMTKSGVRCAMIASAGEYCRLHAVIYDGEEADTSGSGRSRKPASSGAGARAFAEDDSQCPALTTSGTRCKHTKTSDGVCSTHAKMVESGKALRFFDEIYEEHVEVVKPSSSAVAAPSSGRRTNTDLQCRAIKVSGERCTVNAKEDGLCGTHLKVREKHGDLPCEDDGAAEPSHAAPAPSSAASRSQCAGITMAGVRCRNQALSGHRFCSRHMEAEDADSGDPVTSLASGIAKVKLGKKAAKADSDDDADVKPRRK